MVLFFCVKNRIKLINNHILSINILTLIPFEELGLFLLEENNLTNQSAKRVNIVSFWVVKESSLLSKNRHIRSPQDSYDVIRSFIEDADREMFNCMSLDTKNLPTNIQVCHIGSLNASIVHPREVKKMAVFSNSASIIVFHNHPSGITKPSPENLEVTRLL